MVIANFFVDPTQYETHLNLAAEVGSDITLWEQCRIADRRLREMGANFQSCFRASGVELSDGSQTES
jgi:hypothetical protein